MLAFARTEVNELLGTLVNLIKYFAEQDVDNLLG